MAQTMTGKVNSRKILFKGQYSYLISPFVNEQNEIVVDSQDQLVKILKVVGNQKKFYKTDFDHELIYQYYQGCNWAALRDQNRKSLTDLHPDFKVEWLELIKASIRLNKDERYSID